jgi:hypothetical protein
MRKVIILSFLVSYAFIIQAQDTRNLFLSVQFKEFKYEESKIILTFMNEGARYMITENGIKTISRYNQKINLEVGKSIQLTSKGSDLHLSYQTYDSLKPEVKKKLEKLGIKIESVCLSTESLDLRSVGKNLIHQKGFIIPSNIKDLESFDKALLLSDFEIQVYGNFLFLKEKSGK